MRNVPKWALLSAAGAPVFLVGGWTLGASRRRGGFNSVTDTISALAARGADDRWIMTSALAGLGICHVVTAIGLRPAALPGRVLHATGGVATVLVAAFPQPVVGSSRAHVLAAGLGFISLSVWPLFASRRGRGVPVGLRPAEGLAAAAVLLGLLGWFAVEFYSHGDRVGLAERAVSGAQALCPLIIAVAAARAVRGERVAG